MANRFDLVNLSNILQTSANGTVANVNFDSNTLFIDGVNNRVGVGTNAPLASIDVVGSDRRRIRATGAAEEGILLFQNGTTGTGTTNGFLVGIGGDSNAYLLNYHNSAMLFSTNGGERMRIDASGRVTTPAQPAFYARGADTNQTLGNQGDLILATAIYNIGGHYNTSNYRFTAPVAGRYLFTWSVFINAVAGRCTLKVNGSSYNNLQMDVGASLSQSAILNLAANDYVTVGDWQNISGMQYYGGHTHFSGILLS